MATTYYNTIDGSLLGQTTSGVRTDYMMDALGSVTGTTVSGAVQNTYRYMPFGTLLSKTGTSSDPTFLWVGSQGYRATQRSYSDYYVRLRHVVAISGTWTSLDKFCPFESGWGYANYNPTLSADPSGALAATPVVGNGWTASCCGGFASYIKWTGVPKQVGWIIQQIDINLTGYTGCPPQAITRNDLIPVPYYEAWPVSASGEVGNCNPYVSFNDQWNWTTGSMISDWQLTSNIGSIATQGTAIFVAGTPAGFENSFSPSQVYWAGCLVSAWEWNQWDQYLMEAANLGNVAFQSVVYSWNCCCGCPPIGPPNPCFNQYVRIPNYAYYALQNDCPCRGNICSS